MNKEQIKEMLKNYNELNFKIKIAEKFDRKDTIEINKFKKLKCCLDLLQEEEKDLIKTIYEYKISIRKYAKSSFVSHTTIIRRLDKIIAKVANCF